MFVQTDAQTLDWCLGLREGTSFSCFALVLQSHVFRLTVSDDIPNGSDVATLLEMIKAMPACTFVQANPCHLAQHAQNLDVGLAHDIVAFPYPLQRYTNVSGGQKVFLAGQIPALLSFSNVRAEWLRARQIILSLQLLRNQVRGHTTSSSLFGFSISACQL